MMYPRVVLECVLVLAVTANAAKLGAYEEKFDEKHLKRQTGDVRLVNGGNDYMGRVEVLYNGVWGTVCDDLWDELDAQVVCRSLGYGGGIPRSYAYFGQGSGQIWLDNVQCDGTESSIHYCPANPYGDENCHHGEDAGVECDPEAFPEPNVNCPEGFESISESLPSCYKAVHIELYSWDDARRACERLDSRLVILESPGELQEVTVWIDSQHPLSSWATSEHRYWTDGSRASWLWGNGVPVNASLWRTGEPNGAYEGESYIDLLYIPHEWGLNDERSNRQTGYICETTPDEAETEPEPEPEAEAGEGDLRLVDGPEEDDFYVSGRLEVYHQGEWGTVCDDRWGEMETVVACRQLGYTGGLYQAFFGAGQGQIWMDNVDCSGEEESLADCEHNGWGEHNCHHSEDVSIQCVPLTVVEECPESWTTISDSINSCYLANHIERYRRDSAALACRDEAPGAHLVMIETGDEMSALTRWLKADLVDLGMWNAGGMRRYWTSAYYQSSTANWYWTDGVTLDSSLWKDGEPNGFQTGNEIYVDILYEFYSWGLNDEQSGRRTGYVCEIELGK